AQPWRAAALVIERRSARPAGQELVELVARFREVGGMHGADFLRARVAVHDIVEGIDQRAHALGAAQQIVKRLRREGRHSDFITAEAAATAAAMSSPLRAAPRKPASKADGARHTRWSSMPPNNPHKRCTSQ